VNVTVAATGSEKLGFRPRGSDKWARNMSDQQAGASRYWDIVTDTPVAGRTNTLAVLSLVFGIVWCAGIGSLLAVILSVKARRSIRESGGAESGEGLAMAGLVLGILGIVATVLTTLLVVMIGITAKNAVQDAVQRFTPNTVIVPAGRQVTLTTSDLAIDSGIKTVTVFAVTHPVPALNETDIPDRGKEFAVVDTRVCAGPAGSQDGPNGSLFNLTFPGGAQVSPSDTVVVKQPNLLDIRGMGPRQCARGYVTYEIAVGTQPTAVTYKPGPFRTYEWKLPAG
jgi:hypothetical protein